MSKKPVNKPLLSGMDVRCVACFSLDRNLRPMKDMNLMKTLCPRMKFSDYTVVCWECEHTIKKIKQFKARILKTQSLLQTLSTNVHAGRDGLSNLKTTHPSIMSITENESEIKEVKCEPIKINFEESDSELDKIGNDSSNDCMDNWSNTEDSKSNDMTSNSQYQIPMKRPDNSKTSDWLQQEKLNVPKIIGSCTMTLKDLLDQPMQYFAGKSKKSKIENEGTSKKEDEGVSGMNWEREKNRDIIDGSTGKNWKKRSVDTVPSEDTHEATKRLKTRLPDIDMDVEIETLEMPSKAKRVV